MISDEMLQACVCIAGYGTGGVLEFSRFNIVGCYSEVCIESRISKLGQ